MGFLSKITAAKVEADLQPLYHFTGAKATIQIIKENEMRPLSNGVD